MKFEVIKKIYEKKLFSHRVILNASDIQLNYILFSIPKDKEETILDAGCGNGNYAFYLAKIGYKSISAIDLFTSVKTDKFEYRQASIDCTPFQDKSFGFIYSNSVIYYLSYPKDGIDEFHRILKNDGLLFFSAHTKYSLFTLWRIFKRDILKLKEMEHLKGVKFYSANYYKNILEENGFELLLQDGYEVSFFLYPFYKKIVRGFEKFLKIKLPVLNPYINSGILGKIKSEISYHSVFIVRKIDD